ncbi:MAG: ABC transporter permease [Lautropia sp.]
MNPHAAHSASLPRLFGTLVSHRGLLAQMASREISGRYSGSILGFAWSMVNPILMLAIYTLVFSVVFKARWGTGPNESRLDFALILFAGMIVHGFFADVLNRSTGLILGNANYVRRVVFPLELLVPVTLLGVLAHTAISMAVLIAALLVFKGALPWTAVLLPVVFAPLVLLTLGLGWILASLGVYIRDVGQAVGLLTTVLLFVSPMFYPISAVPAELRTWIHLNPLTFIMEQTREVLIWGRMPSFAGLLLYTVLAAAVALAGFWWFQRTRKGFSDVL